MYWVVVAQTAPTVTHLVALVRRLVRGSLGVAYESGTTLLFLIAWFGVLAAITAVLQGDRRRWLRGFADVRGHMEQFAAGLDILRRNKRPLWVLLAAAVLSWTGWSLRTWQDPASKDELEVMLAERDNSASRFAASNALATAVVPFRGLVGLGDSMPLLVGACILLFARTTQISHALRSRTRAVENVRLKRRVGAMWLGLIVLAAYRTIVFIVVPNAAPMADCMFVNALVVPILTVAADAVILSWVLVELGRALRGSLDWQPDDSVAFVRTIPAAAIACLLLNFGRYLLLLVALWHSQFLSSNWSVQRWSAILAIYTIAQLFGLAWLGYPSVLIVDRRAGYFNPFRTYLGLVRRAGGQLVGMTMVAVLLGFLAVLPFYWIFGTMQRETWSLLGAASYANYVTLLIGIVTLAAFADLAQRELGIIGSEPFPAVVMQVPPVALAVSQGTVAPS